ncbi:hypothetical protein HUW51_21585 [Adhaeribacter swui]|uniref:Uncharacterized protein n=1 Tax=Adhaeribacter swui TaxID=2086471 RepID=A0A7G7GDE7_9BACT|nr:hypothetical protein [Adhaeribacter swui]QNF35181.1 hypothetical protein HUW51_21585 [Adhaeribacter swui]
MYKKKILDKNKIQKVRFNNLDLAEPLTGLGLATTGLALLINGLVTNL